MATAMIGLHAERTNDPRAVRWVMPAGSLPVGVVRQAPGSLGVMLAEGRLTAGAVEHTALWLWLRDGESWTAHGAAVHAALREALSEPGGWHIDRAPGEVLALVTRDVLGGSVGDFIDSHGGAVRVSREADDCVVVELGGACEHCPASGHTLRQRLMSELRRRCPDVVESDRDGRRLTLRLDQRPD